MSMNRESWLQSAMPYIDTLFTEAGHVVPSNIRVTCGFPSVRPLARKRKRIGECWDKTASKDGTFEIMLSPIIDEPILVLATLIHEVVHAVVGLEAGHKKPFIDVAKAVGLVKPWTATSPTPELKAILEEWVSLKLGKYPHAALVGKEAEEKAKQTTRLLLLQCDCGCKVRTTQKWLEQYVEDWPCPCGGIMRREQKPDLEEAS